MKILVCIKRVVDYNVKVRVKADATGVELANVKMSMNPFDEIAVEEAVRLKEKGAASEVIVVSIGEEKAQETLRAAMAVGADRGIHIASESVLEPLMIAKLLQKIVEKEQPSLIFLGKQAIDDDANQTGQMLAGLLQYPQATCISQVTLNGDSVRIAREVDAGMMICDLTLPAVLTTDLRLNEPRYAKLPDIMKARSKPLEKLLATELGVDLSPKLKLLRVAEPSKRKAGIKVATVEELVHKLHHEAKVI
jgi:electron transfer flavoprotein beta subunit